MLFWNFCLFYQNFSNFSIFLLSRRTSCYPFWIKTFHRNETVRYLFVLPQNHQNNWWHWVGFRDQKRNFWFCILQKYNLYVYLLNRLLSNLYFSFPLPKFWCIYSASTSGNTLSLLFLVFTTVNDMRTIHLFI